MVVGQQIGEGDVDRHARADGVGPRENDGEGIGDGQSERVAEDGAGAADDASETRRLAAEIDSRLPALEAAAVEADRAWRTALSSRKPNIEQLRSELRPGTPCPVCGALDHPWVSGEGPLLDELVEKSGRLYAATGGAGVFVLDLAAPTQWSEFNSGLPVFTAGTVVALALHGTTLVAPAGPNGFVYRFPEGATEWQEVAIVPPIAPGLLPTDLIVAGSDLLVGTPNRVYRSDDDAQTWTFVGHGISSSGTAVFLASEGAAVFAGVDSLGSNHLLYRSVNRGDSWKQIDVVPGAFLFALEVAGEGIVFSDGHETGLFDWRLLRALSK